MGPLDEIIKQVNELYRRSFTDGDRVVVNDLVENLEMIILVKMLIYRQDSFFPA